MINDSLKLIDICSKIEILIRTKYDEDYEQDKILIDYLKCFNELLSSSINNNNLVNTMALVRKFIFYFDQLIKRLPPRATKGFWAHFFNKKWRGELFEKSNILYNEIVNSELFKEMHNIEGILKFAETEHYLNISFMSINIELFQKIQDIKDIKGISIENTNLIIDGKEEFLFQSTRINFIDYLSTLNHLETIDLSSNNLKLILKKNQIDDEKISELGNVLSNLKNLKILNLSSNQIDDDILMYLFHINNKGNLFSKSDAFPSLIDINLSRNLIRLDKYHQNKPAEKLFLDTLYKRNIHLNLAFNHIHNFVNNKHLTSPIFDQSIYPNISIGQTLKRFKTESLINSDYMLDEKNCLIVIADHISTEHAQILSESLDENRQYYVMKYHLVENTDNTKCCGTQVVIEMTHGGNYFYFIKDRAIKYRFGKFYIVKKADLEKLENKIINDSKTGIDASLYKLHFSCCGSAINCFRYCLNILQEFEIDKSISQPLISLPRWYLNIITPIPPSYGRLCIETTQITEFSRKQKSVITASENTFASDYIINDDINSEHGMHTQPTAGKGDCAFHAIFGEFNGIEYICKDVKERRKEIASKIRNCINDPDLYKLVKEAIKALIMEYKPTAGTNITNAQNQLKQYINDDQKRLQTTWDKFNSILKNMKNVIEFIEIFCKEYCDKKNKSFQSLADIHKFHTCLNESGNALSGMIKSIPELDKAFQQYNNECTIGFNWDEYCTKLALINEYADFMETLGNWLIPAELYIIGHIYNITIDFYSKDPTKPNSVPQKCDSYNPGKSHIVSVCFNGIDHYLRLKKNGTIKKSLISSTENTTDEFMKAPSKIEYLRKELKAASGYNFELVKIDENNLQIVCIQHEASHKNKIITITKLVYALEIIIIENGLDKKINFIKDDSEDTLHLKSSESIAMKSIVAYLNQASDMILSPIPFNQSFFYKSRNIKFSEQKRENKDNGQIEVNLCKLQ